jgi:predicted nucleic acid-binding Zn ribbon protein
MADKVNSKPEKKKNAMTPEQRSRRTQQILFGLLAVIMIFSMVISLVAR